MPSVSSQPVTGFSPLFLKPPETQGDQDLGTQDDQRISYTPRVHGEEISAFENSGDLFDSFKKEFIARLDEVIAFAQCPGGDGERVMKAFKGLHERLFDVDNHFYDKRKKVLYGAGKRALDKLTDLLGNEALPFDSRLGVVKQLARDVTECATGAAANLALAAQKLNLMLAGDEIYGRKEQVARQLMLTYIKYFREIPRQWEIHFVNVLQNAWATEIGLPMYEDKYTSLCRVTTEQIEGCLPYILKHLTPALLACSLADECLSQFDATMQAHFAELQNGDTSASFAYGASEDALDAAMIQIGERCGNVEISDVISPLDDSLDWRINTDATLITLKILQSLSVRHQLTEDYFPKKLIGYIGEDGIEIVIEHYGAQLVWATKNGKPVLFTVEYLKKPLCPDNLDEDVARLLVATAIKNSSQAEVLASLSSDWLDDADTTQWVSKMDGKTFLPFLETHKAAIQNRTPSQRFDVARDIVACGRVSAFDAYIAFNPGLFDASEKALETLVKFGIAAAKNKDMGMLDAVMNLILETIEQSSSIPESFLAMMERSLRKNVNRSEYPSEARVILSFYVGNILTKLCEKGSIKPFQLEELFSCKGVEQRPGFSFLMNNGRSRQVRAFGKVLLHAAGKGVLPSKQLFKLLQATHGGHSAFSLALQNQDAATVTAFGRTVVSAYNMGFLDSKQVGALVAHKESDPRRRAFGNDVLEAYRQILQDIDVIKARSMK